MGSFCFSENYSVLIFQIILYFYFFFFLDSNFDTYLFHEKLEKLEIFWFVLSFCTKFNFLLLYFLLLCVTYAFSKIYKFFIFKCRVLPHTEKIFASPLLVKPCISTIWFIIYLKLTKNNSKFTSYAWRGLL